MEPILPFHPSALNVIAIVKQVATTANKLDLRIAIPKKELVETEEENVTPTPHDYHYKEYQFTSHCTLKDFVEKLGEEFDYIRTVQFLYKNTLVPLTEKLEKVFALESVFAIVNDSIKYKIDFNNKYNRRGNTEFKQNSYEKAIRFYTTAIQRFPKSIKTLCNRAISYLRLEQYENCILDCNRFFEMIEENPDIEDAATKHKAYFRRGKSFYGLAKQIYEMSQANYDSDNVEVNLEEKYPHLRSILSDTFEEEFWKEPNASLSKEEQYQIKAHKWREIALELYKRFDEDFCHVDSGDESKKSHQDLIVQGLNRLLLHNIKPKMCSLCQTSADSLIDIAFLPDKIFEDLKQRATMKLDVPLAEDGSQKLYPLLCSKCFSKVHQKRNNFVEKVWNLYMENTEQSCTVSERDTKLISNFIGVCAWFFLITSDLQALGYEHLSKFLFKISKVVHLSLDQPAPGTYLFVSKPEGYQMSEQVSNYLKNYSASIDVDFHLEKPNYLHFKLDALHLVQALGSSVPLDWENCAVPSRRDFIIEQASQRVVPTTFNEVLDRIAANRHNTEDSMLDE